MSFYGGEFFGADFLSGGSVSGPFFDGPFFGGGFFGEAGEVVEVEEVETRARPADNEKKRRSIYKPTGLPPYRKTVEERIEETREIEREVFEEEVVKPPVHTMSQLAIDAEIGALLRKKMRTDDEELLLLVLAVAVAG
jgi:hypothetical protein